MRLIVRSQSRLPCFPERGAAVPRSSADARRAWIEALFADHLPRSHRQREEAIERLAGDHAVWRLLHQARHSLAETNATIERLARAALAPPPLQAA